MRTCCPTPDGTQVLGRNAVCVSANRDYSPCKFVSPPSRPTLTCVEYGLFLCLFCTQLSNRETYCTHPKSPTVQVCAAGAGWGEVCMVPSWLVNLFLARLFWGITKLFITYSGRLLVRPVQHTSSLLVRPSRILNDWTLVHLNLGARSQKFTQYIHPIHVVQNYRWRKTWHGHSGGRWGWVEHFPIEIFLYFLA